MFEEKAWECEAIQDDLTYGLFGKTKASENPTPKLKKKKKTKKRGKLKKSADRFSTARTVVADKDMNANISRDLNEDINKTDCTDNSSIKKKKDKECLLGENIGDKEHIEGQNETSITMENLEIKHSERIETGVQKDGGHNEAVSDFDIKNSEKLKTLTSRERGKKKGKKRKLNEDKTEENNVCVKHNKEDLVKVQDETAVAQLGVVETEKLKINVEQDKKEKKLKKSKKKKLKKECEEPTENKTREMMTNKECATVSVQHNEDNLSKEQLNEDIRSTEVANNQMKIQSTLHQKLQKKLEGGRFRWINEQLYTSTGSKALDLFRKDPHLFDVYHKGFGLQVQSWPKNPVHVMIRWLQQRPSTLVVADFGCGDAVLAQNVCNKVHSFDLMAKNQHVTVCDMANVPLPNSSVDIAVFCLSLMGTNLLDFLKEAHRVLKPGGILKVAEVVSRFEDLDTFLKCLTQLGFQLNEKDESNKMFVLFEMTKVGKLNKKLKMEDLQLKACIYKKR